MIKWYHNLIDITGKITKGLLATATLPYYLAGKGIWYRHEENSVRQVRLAFIGKPILPQGPGTNLDLKKISFGLFNYAKDNISMETKEIDIPVVEGVSADNIRWKVKNLQFKYEPRSSRDALEWAWEYGQNIGLAKDTFGAIFASQMARYQAFPETDSLGNPLKDREGKVKYPGIAAKVPEVAAKTMDIINDPRKKFGEYGLKCKGVSAREFNYEGEGAKIAEELAMAKQKALAQIIEAEGERKARDTYRKIEEEDIESRNKTANAWLEATGITPQDPLYRLMKSAIMAETQNQQMKFQRAQEAGKGGFYSEGNSGGLGNFFTTMILANILKNGGLENILGGFGRSPSPQARPEDKAINVTPSQ